jgi:hypothetical protein
MIQRLIFLWVACLFFSFAMAQSQMVKGTLLPTKKKSVLILPGNKKDSIATIQKNASIPVLKPASNGLPVLAGLDTSAPDQTHSYTVEPFKSNLKAQYLSGTLTPEQKNKNIFKPVPEDSIIKINHSVVPPGTKIKHPLDVLDTTKMITGGGDVISKYDLPPQRSSLRPQLINGTVVAKEKGSVIIIPIPADSLMKQSAEPGMAMETNPLFPPEREIGKDTLIAVSTVEKDVSIKTITQRSLLDGLDTSDRKFDPAAQVYKYTLDPTLYKHQSLTGVIDAKNGESKVFWPLRRDSLEATNNNPTDSLAGGVAKEGMNNSYIDPAPLDTAVRINPDAAFSITHVPVVTTDKSVKTNFFVNQTGRFSVRFITDQFYLNISQSGKVIDFDILSNGKIITNNNSKILQVGNIKVSYNTDGSVKTIGDFAIAYTYDGKVNRVDNLKISYNNEGNIEKVSDIPVQYIANGKVGKISTYRVGYNVKQMVIGIDDSEGLVVFKPEVLK